MRNIVFIILTSVTLFPNVYGQNPELVMDLGLAAQSSFPSFPEEFFNYNGKLFFWADDGNLGEEPHIYDPVTQELISFDINKGESSSVPPFNTDAIAVFNDILYFSAENDDLGTELWLYDGQNFKLAGDINPGEAHSYPQHFEVFDNRLFIRATGKNGRELFTIDEDNKIQEFKDIAPGPTSSTPSNLTALSEKIMAFTASSVGDGCDIWISDGTLEGTKQVAIIDNSGSCGISNWTLIENMILFSYDDGVHGIEPYFFTGDAVKMIADINPGTGSSSPNSFTLLNGEIYFEANDGDGRQLWKTDLSLNGTEAVSDSSTDLDQVDHLINFDNTLYFEGRDDELWKSDGTNEGTILVKDLDQSIQYITKTPNKLQIETTEYWVSDGTTFGTVMITPVNPNGSSDIDNLYAIDNTVYYIATDGQSGKELWMNSNTAISSMIAEINAKNSGSLRTTVVFSDKFYFRGSSSGSIYYGDGSELNMFPGSQFPAEIYGITLLQEWNGHLYFTLVNENDNNVELWRTDGTELGTQQVKVLGSFFQHFAIEVIGIDTEFYFYSEDEIGTGFSIWRTDGTELGTQILYMADRNDLALFNGDVFSVKDVGSIGRELYKNDILLKDINPSGSGSPEDFFEFDGTLYFTASGGASGRELWKTDGTSDGTMIVKDINPEVLGTSNPSRFSVGENYFYFRAREESENDSPYFLWKSDGTNTGTNKVSENEAFNLYAYQGDVYYSGSTDGENFELWKYDGVTNSLLKEINAEGSSSPMEFFALDDVIYFSADNCEYGRELWKTDGTTLGTELVYDLNPGVASSSPSRLVQFGNSLLFNADDGVHGRELFILKSCADSINEVCSNGPCDLTTSYAASGEINLEGFFRILNATEIDLNSGTATNLMEDFEVLQGGILNVLTTGCN